MINDDDRPATARAIRLSRHACGLTQAELAQRSAIHPGRVFLLEAGRRTPRAEELARLADVLGRPELLELGDGASANAEVRPAPRRGRLRRRRRDRHVKERRRA